MEVAFLVVLIFILSPTQAKGVPIPECCSSVSGVCRSSCEKISLMSVALDESEKEKVLKNLTLHCAKDLTVFWHCVNGSLQAVEDSNGWFARPCCTLSRSRSCRLACLKAKSRQDLYQDCRQSDEISFFDCVHHREDAERCCSNSQTDECKAACREIFFLRQPPTRKARDAVVYACAHHSPKVLRCVKEHVKGGPTTTNEMRNEYSAPNSADLGCCEKSSNLTCRSVCTEALHAKTSEMEIVNTIVAACKLPSPYDEPWKCFLQHARPVKSENNRHDRIGVDSAKLQCCQKAVSESCMRLCFQTFDSEWNESWERFDRKCTNNLAESEMLRCLTEVDEPCKLGCKGLSFCTNFNDRSTELFQSCTVESDVAARREMEKWQTHSSIDIPSMSIHVRDIATCYPEVWKTIACTLQVKPCHQSSHAAPICKSDCTDILRKCLDYNSLPIGVTPESVCQILSPHADEQNCLSLASFLNRSPNAGYSHQITHPCESNNCKATDVCMVDRDCVRSGDCTPYVCHPGCKMGDSSAVVVPYGSYVRIPSLNDSVICYKTCRCSERLIIEDCQQMQCSQPSNCRRNNRKIEHGKVYNVDCNQCVCYDGVVTCTKFVCADDAQRNSVSYTGLPCNCIPHYVPVCGSNGKTYPSACIARCLGLKEKEFEYGPCSTKNSCHSVVCPVNQRCIPKKTVCLSVSYANCKQYECVGKHSDCAQEPYEVVCSTRNVEYDNFCWLLKSNETLAYRGKCKKYCDAEKIVCGQNGETYVSECAALADDVKVDYEGPCMAVGNAMDGIHGRCARVKCRTPMPSNCIRVMPPGSCCPVCGGALQILYSANQIDASLRVLDDAEQLTVHDVVSGLRRHIQTAECDVFAFLDVYNALDVLVAPVYDQPTALQVNACIAEADKIALLVQHGSPTLLSDVALSPLVAVRTLPTFNSGFSKSASATLLSSMLILKTLLRFV